MNLISIKTTIQACVIVAILLLTTSCERELSDKAVLPTFATTPEVFTDDFIGMGSDFYFPFADAKPGVFSVDNTVGFESSASIRIDVPNADDPTGGYAGAIFRTEGAGRNLTQYDALTFYAKASTGIKLGEAGYGIDYLEDKYRVSVNTINVGTNWTKIIIPVPNPAKLLEERGLFWFSAGSDGNGGAGYTLWFDEIKFEKLGTIKASKPAIFDSKDVEQTAFFGVPIALSGISILHTLPSGLDQKTNVAAAYLALSSTNESVATVNEKGVATIQGIGSTVITASLNGELAEGSLTINSVGDFKLAPTPTRNPTKVTSIFSDHYVNVPIDFYNGYWEPWQTTVSKDFAVNGDNILGYTNFNFVGNQFGNPTVDATTKPNLHINMYIPNDVPANLDFLITIKDFGADKKDGGGDDQMMQVFFKNADYVADSWATLEIPLSLSNRNNIGQIIYENVNGSSLKDFYLDNIYFYEN